MYLKVGEGLSQDLNHLIVFYCCDFNNQPGKKTIICLYFVIKSDRDYKCYVRQY